MRGKCNSPDEVIPSLGLSYILSSICFYRLVSVWYVLNAIYFQIGNAFLVYLL